MFLHLTTTSTISQIDAYSTKLAQDIVDVDIITFLKNVCSKFYPTVDLTFMEYFISLVPRTTEFCVTHDKLKQYKIFNNYNSNNIAKKLSQLGFIENEHFKIEIQEIVNKHGSTSQKYLYTMTPHTFKTCLIRFAKTTKYSDYFILLEIVLTYYNKYQLAIKNYTLNALLSNQDKKISDLKISLDELKRTHFKMGIH